MSPDALHAKDALFLDFDGTLVDIAEHPERVILPGGLARLLDDVQVRLGGAVAIVSGRRLEDVDHWLQPIRFAGGGVHGAQLRRLRDADIEILEARDLAPVADAARAVIAQLPGAWVEDKRSSIALHYRAAPESAAPCLALAQELADRYHLRTLHGKMVVELKLAGPNKGAVVRTLMSAPPFASRRPIFVGDDLTDEDGFSAAAELGGHGIRIGPGESCAKYRLPDVGATIRWLASFAESS